MTKDRGAYCTGCRQDVGGTGVGCFFLELYVLIADNGFVVL